MKSKLIPSLVLAGCATFTLHAADAPASAPAPAPASTSADFTAQVRAIVTSVEAKLQKGLRKESDFTDDLAAFDKLFAAHQGEKSEAMAQAEYMKDVLYFQFFNEPDKGIAGYKHIVATYPDTQVGKELGRLIPQIEAQAKAQVAAEAVQKDLEVGKTFPEFSVASGQVLGIDGKPLSVAEYHGKVVLIDFWATWCGPCMMEMPNVIAAYDKYHARGFDIIGVSLDQPAGLATLPAFLQEHKMPWRQFCDGKFWSNELAVKYGIHAIPMSFLVGRDGKIIGSGLAIRGPALAPAIEAALAAKP